MSLLHKLTGHDKSVRIEQVLDDFIRRYKYTYMQLKVKDETSIVYIRGPIGDAGIKVQNHQGDTADYAWSTIDLQPLMPVTGYYQTDGGLLFLQKKATKQYKRSLCADAYSFSADTDSNIFFHLKDNYYPFKLEDLDVDSPDVALSRLWACIYNKRQNRHELVYRTVPVGIFDFEKKSITPIIKKLSQEIEDFCKRHTDKSWKIINIE